MGVTREVDGWIAVDQRNAGQYYRIKSELKTGGDNIIGKFLAFYPEFINDSIERMEFNCWWKNLSDEEKLEFIQKEHEKIARSMGMEPVPVTIVNIDGDTVGDYQPFLYEIRIEVDNRKGSDILETIAHETRHRYQHDCLVYYEQTGNAPEGISIEQVTSWKSDFDNYINSEDDPNGYYNQSVELDAKSFGRNYEPEYWNQVDEPQ